MKTRREQIMDVVNDAVRDLMFYDRKQDEDVPVGAIQEAIDAGEITLDEIVERFREQMITWQR